MQIKLLTAANNIQAKIIYSKDCSNHWINGAVSDSGAVKGGELFICIKGKKVNGHDFALEAVQKGAVAILAEENNFAPDFPVPILLVQDSVKALGLLAKVVRKEFQSHGKVIAITGSAGKTSLKEMLAHILSINSENLNPQANNVGRNLHNFNTQIGVSLAILNFSGHEKYWVLEVGISKAHDMQELGEIIEPDFAIILNIANAHHEGLGELGIAYHKASLLKYLQEDGMAFVNFDYTDLVVEAKKYNKNIVYFSVVNNSDNHKEISFSAKQLGLNHCNFAKFEMQTPSGNFEVESPLIGMAGAENCLAATSLATALGLSSEIIGKGIATQTKPKMRFNLMQKNNWEIIDDCYNANLLSNLRMMEAGVELAAEREFIVVLGEMLELGNLSASEHHKLGLEIANINIKLILWIGNQADHVKSGLDYNGFKGDFIEISDFKDFENCLEAKILEKSLPKVILFKGSRSNRLENYLNKFVELCDAV